MANVHPTAIVDEKATLAADVSVGAFTFIGPEVTIGPGTKVHHHASIVGTTSIGSGCTIFPFASIGTPPQDLKYKGEKTRLVIGDANIIREFVTMNLGTVGGGGITQIGNHNLLMAYCHVAHDCLLADRIIMANNATLAGHVRVENDAIIGGLSAVHQFVHIGTQCMIGGCAGVDMDIPPYTSAAGNRAKLFGLNLIGLKRKGYSTEQIADLKKAYRILFRSGLMLKEALTQVEQELAHSAEAMHLLAFIRQSERGVTRPER